MGPGADLVERSRAPGAEAGARALAGELARVDQAQWAALLPVLRAVAASVAPRFADVMAPEDVAGELALGAWDGWLADWSRRVGEGRERRSLHVFLRDRLRDHLRELRRKNKRRRLLLTPGGLGPAVETGDAAAPIGTAIFASEPEAPDARVSADELRAAAAGDAQARAVIALRERGFTQAEIAEVLKVSRPTVTRRIAAIAAVLLATVGVLALVVLGRESRVEVTELEPETTAVAPSPGAVAPRSGTLEVTSLAPTAIFIDGVAVGLTPLRLEVSAGVHVIEARREGYGTYRRVVSVGADHLVGIALADDVWPPPEDRETEAPEIELDPTELEADPPARRRVVRGLRRASPPASQGHGTVRINTVPWARVFVDGRDTGRNTPVRSLRLPAGQHRLGLRTPDGTMHFVSITVRADQVLTIMRQL